MSGSPDGPQQNVHLRGARESVPSPRVPGACLSRVELAEAVNDWLYRNTGRCGALDGNYIARLERGAVRRPGRDYRAGFRAVLGATDDVELGFVVPSRSHGPLRAPQSADLDPARVMPTDDEAPATVTISRERLQGWRASARWWARFRRWTRR